MPLKFIVNCIIMNTLIKSINTQYAIIYYCLLLSYGSDRSCSTLEMLLRKFEDCFIICKMIKILMIVPTLNLTVL